MAVEVQVVQNRADLKRFVAFGNDLYKKNPYHIPLLLDDELNTLDKEKNPAFEFCETVYFLAYRDKKLVGRIAGIINHRANETWNQNNARFGFVDFINDNEVVDALFSAVENWARSRNMDMLQGPMGFTDLDRQGMLVEGFDQLGTLATNYNYAYYPKQMERLGFIKDQDWKEFKIQMPESIPEKHLRIAEIVKEKYGLRVVKFNSRKELPSYIGPIFETLNKAYAHLYGFSELSPAQIDYYAKMYIPLLRLDFVTVIERIEDNKVVGFAVALPSLSNALKQADGKLFPFGFFALVEGFERKSEGGRPLFGRCFARVHQ